MNEWETLAAIDHAMMQVDIDMMEWQGHLDMAALAGVGQPFELWTNDDPPVVVTKENFETQIGKNVRLMAFHNDQWIKLGEGTMNATGDFKVYLPAPQLAQFPYKDRVEYERLARTAGSGVIEMPDPENHPFFKE